MPKKVKVLVGVLVAVVVLITGGVATVMADEEPQPVPPAGGKGLLARVAEILDIPQEDLASAFKQARQQIREEAFTRFLDKAVEKGLIDEEEARQIEEWWENRPEAIDRLSRRACIFPAMRSRQAAVLGKAGEGGCITQDRIDKIKEWWEQKPGALDHKVKRSRIFPALRGRQMIAVPKGWHQPGPPLPAD